MSEFTLPAPEAGIRQPESYPPTVTEILGKTQAARYHLDEIAERTHQIGLDTPDLESLITTLGVQDSPLRRRPILASAATRLDADPTTIEKLCRDYAKTKVRATEDGDLRHYHQTSLDAFEQIARTRAIMSNDALRQLGRAEQAGGRRPDVVQFTRDHYDPEGDLVAQGFTGNNPAARTGVTLVFGDEIMDDPDYDCLGKYPALPKTSLRSLTTVIVDSQDGIPEAARILQENDLALPVISRDMYLEQYQLKA